MKKLDLNSGKLMYVTLFKGDKLKHGIPFLSEDQLVEILDALLEGIKEEDIDVRFFEIEGRTYSSNGVHMLKSGIVRSRIDEMGYSWDGHDAITKGIEGKLSRGERVTEGEFYRQQKEYEELEAMEKAMKLVEECPYADEFNHLFRKIMDWNEDIEAALTFPVATEELDGKEYVSKKLNELKLNW